jgi:hypothetical protein
MVATTVRCFPTQCPLFPGGSQALSAVGHDGRFGCCAMVSDSLMVGASEALGGGRGGSRDRGLRGRRWA